MHSPTWTLQLFYIWQVNDSLLDYKHTDDISTAQSAWRCLLLFRTLFSFRQLIPTFPNSSYLIFRNRCETYISIQNHVNVHTGSDARIRLGAADFPDEYRLVVIVIVNQTDFRYRPLPRLQLLLLTFHKQLRHGWIWSVNGSVTYDVWDPPPSQHPPRTGLCCFNWRARACHPSHPESTDNLAAFFPLMFTIKPWIHAHSGFDTGWLDRTFGASQVPKAGNEKVCGQIYNLKWHPSELLWGQLRSSNCWWSLLHYHCLQIEFGNRWCYAAQQKRLDTCSLLQLSSQLAAAQCVKSCRRRWRASSTVHHAPTAMLGRGGRKARMKTLEQCHLPGHYAAQWYLNLKDWPASDARLWRDCDSVAGYKLPVSGLTWKSGMTNWRTATWRLRRPKTKSLPYPNVLYFLT